MARFNAKPMRKQVIVITGASSGIGLATAVMAAKRGAQVVAASRNIRDLEEAQQIIEAEGGKALAVEADVSVFADMVSLRDRAVESFGRIDTWVNNAGASMYGYLTDTPLEKERQLFETNFWGVRHGCKVAVEAMSKEGGVIINIGSEVSGRSVPLQGLYAATKHAVKAFTDALRMELDQRDIPIKVSLVRPSAIDTPFTEHAVNHLQEGEPSLPFPIYHPNLVAKAILKCAVSPQRDVYVGAPARIYEILDTLAPKFADGLQENMMFKRQTQGSSVPHSRGGEALMGPASKEGRIRGGHGGRVSRFSVYTALTTFLR